MPSIEDVISAGLDHKMALAGYNARKFLALAQDGVELGTYKGVVQELGKVRPFPVSSFLAPFLAVQLAVFSHLPASSLSRPEALSFLDMDVVWEEGQMAWPGNSAEGRRGGEPAGHHTGHTCAPEGDSACERCEGVPWQDEAPTSSCSSANAKKAAFLAASRASRQEGSGVAAASSLSSALCSAARRGSARLT